MKGDGSMFGGRGLLIASVAFILIVGAIFFAITGGLFGGGNEEADRRVAVTDILEGRSVRMTVEGPVVANEDRESYQVEVGVDSRRVEVMKGYDTSIVGTSVYSNNRQAYTEFVYALSRAGIDDVRELNEEAADERGVCASGRQYIFEVLDNGRSLTRAWTTSCSRSSGTLNADPRDLKDLFDKQVPDRSAVLKAIKLR